MQNSPRGPQVESHGKDCVGDAPAPFPDANDVAFLVALFW
jgi:hypothetical protein